MWAKKTEIVCHCSLLMLLELAEQSIQLLNCMHTSRLRLCYSWPQDNSYSDILFISIYSGNQSKSQEKVWAKKTEIICHWSLLMLLELADQSIQLLQCHISRWRLCDRSPQDNQSKSWKKVWPLFFCCHWSLLMPLAPAEQSIQLLIGAEQQLLLYHTIN